MSATPAPDAAAMPPAVYAVATSRTCSANQMATIQAPHLVVDGTVTSGTLALTIRLVSNEPTSLAPAAWRAFVAVDGRPLILNLPAGGSVSLAYPGLGAGTHSVHYGVYVGGKLVQDRFFCREIPPT
jgi:hypothetical protein